MHFWLFSRWRRWQVFAQCAACHKLDASGKSGIGPNLYRVIGRRSGKLKGFAYSPAMVTANRIWNARSLDVYLAGPAAAMPGNRMPYAGLRNPRDRADLIAYLGAASR
jgi:cytochrome c